jgi:hypothetical protein
MTPEQRHDMDRDLNAVRHFEPLNIRRASWWERHGEEFGLFLWMCAVTLAGSCFVMTFDKVLSWFR